MSDASAEASQARWRRSDILVTGIIGLIALAARLAAIYSRGGGLTGDFGYDAGVYYAAGDALMHGRSPYHGQFVFVHPPIIALFSAPFAGLGRLTSAPIGFGVETIAMCVVGALNAMLVWRVARRFGATSFAAAPAAALYAVWVPTVSAESSIRLEPIGNLVLLLALDQISGAHTRPGAGAARTREALLIGTLFAVLINIKIWWIVPIVLLSAAYLARRRSGRDVVVLGSGFFTTCALIDGPFFAIAGRRMYSSIVSAQFGREDFSASVWDRITRLTSVRQVAIQFVDGTEALRSWAVRVAVVIVIALAVAVCARASATSWGRLLTVVLIAQLVVLLSAQRFFTFYVLYVAVPLVLLVALAATPARRSRHLGRRPRVLCSMLTAAAVVAAVCTLIVLTRDGTQTAAPLADTDRLKQVTDRYQCIVGATPMGLIEVDALDRSFADGCTDWVDVHAAANDAPHPPGIMTTTDKEQNYAQYLYAARVFLVPDALTVSELPGQTRHWLKNCTPIIAVGDRILYRTSACPTPPPSSPAR